VAEILPSFNTALILISGVFLAAGYRFIRRRQITAHHRCMLAATVFAALFLVVYIARWLLFPTKRFPGEGGAYAFYLSVLVPHVLAATAVAPLALVTLSRAFRKNFLAHRRIARVTLPVWAFAVVTGWIVYLMLYVIDWG
jgi:putative membrane protein